MAATANFQGQGSFAQASYTQNGITVEASANVNINNLNGLGVVGGGDDLLIETGESVTFTFGTQIATTFSVSRGTAVNGDADGNLPEVNVEAFDTNGVSLGVVRFNNLPNNSNLLTSFGSVSISKIIFSPLDGDALNMRAVTATLAAPPVPPAAAPNLADAAVYVLSRTSQAAVSGYSDMVHTRNTFELPAVNELLSPVSNVIGQTPIGSTGNMLSRLIAEGLSKLGIDSSWWFSVKQHHIRESTSGKNFTADLGQYAVGNDVWRSKTSKVSAAGVAFAVEHLNARTAFNDGTLNGTGLTALPYMTLELLPNTTAELLLGVSNLDYEISSSLSEGEFKSWRYFPSASLVHRRNFGNLAAGVRAKVDYFNEDAQDITDNRGNTFPMNSIKGGNASLGADASYPLFVSGESRIELEGGYMHHFNFDWNRAGAIGGAGDYNRRNGSDDFSFALNFINFHHLTVRAATGYTSDHTGFNDWNFGVDFSVSV